MSVQFVFCCYPGKTVIHFSSFLQVSYASYICFFWWVLIFPSGVWHVGCASQFMGCQTFSFSSCCRCCQNTKLVKKEEKLFSASVQLFSSTLSLRLTDVFRMIPALSWLTRDQPAVPSTCKVARLLSLLQVLWLFPDSLITWLYWDKNTNMAKGKSHINIPICS